jgi:hypothetical protein
MSEAPTRRREPCYSPDIYGALATVNATLVA